MGLKSGLPSSSQSWEESSQIMFGRRFGRISGRSERRFERRFWEDLNFFRSWAMWWITYQSKAYVLFIKPNKTFLSDIFIFHFRNFLLKHCGTYKKMLFFFFFFLLDKADSYIIVKPMLWALRTTHTIFLFERYFFSFKHFKKILLLLYFFLGGFIWEEWQRWLKWCW